MIWASMALAAPVVCDPAEAARILEDARIDEARAPVTHPELVPGLARSGADPALARALDALCAPGAELSVDRGDAWQGASEAAYTVRGTRAAEVGCSLVQERVVLSVGVGGTGTTYSLLEQPPTESTPMGACQEPAAWHEERVLAGAAGPVRLVLAVDHVGDEVVASAIEARRASAGGWTQQVLQASAPARYLESQGGGPAFQLGRTRGGQTVVVASGDRTAAPCEPRGGQRVWTWTGTEWIERAGRDALLLLAQEGLWRLAGDAGWMLVLAQDDVADEPLLGPRMRRLQRRDPEALFVFPSSDFPELNAGFLVIAPAPWPTEEEARAARPRWRRGAYVKRAWEAPDPCAP